LVGEGKAAPEKQKTGVSLLLTPVIQVLGSSHLIFPRKNRGWFDPTLTRGRGAWGLRAGAGPNRLRQRR
ncbi:hypothetical protein, partial [Mesorhizobium sp.]|uniref:hypothetical protein n=1 Tax=Mesorhizobium sp. TaxID=1871066 RepID=UPI0025F818B1